MENSFSLSVEDKGPEGRIYIIKRSELVTISEF